MGLITHHRYTFQSMMIQKSVLFQLYQNTYTISETVFLFVDKEQLCWLKKISIIQSVTAFLRINHYLWHSQGNSN